MKTMVTLLMACYVLLLACIPCQDEAEDVAGDSDRVTVVHQAAGAHNEAPDLCSPFCICACCASVTIATHVPALPATNAFQWAESPVFSYLPTICTGDLAGFWQPPQLKV